MNAATVGTVYGLIDPAKPDNLRYIGQTTRRLGVRLRDHIEDARRGKKHHRAKWVRKLIRLGRKPLAVAIATNVPLDHLDQIERALIAAFKESGVSLLNGTSGGDGCAATLPVREKMSAIAKARCCTPEWRATVSAREKARLNTPEGRAQMKAFSDMGREKRLQFMLSEKNPIRQPDAQAKRLESLRRSLLKPEVQKRFAEANARKRNVPTGPHSPEAIQKMRDAVRAAWDDPVRRAKRLAATAATKSGKAVA